MEFHLTRHAKNRMRLYGVTAQEVEETLAHPTFVTPGAFGRQHAWKQGGQGLWLRVAFKDEGTRRVVITVTPKRHRPGGQDAHRV